MNEVLSRTDAYFSVTIRRSIYSSVRRFTLTSRSLSVGLSICRPVCPSVARSARLWVNLRDQTRCLVLRVASVLPPAARPQRKDASVREEGDGVHVHEDGLTGESMARNMEIPSPGATGHCYFLRAIALILIT